MAEHTGGGAGKRTIPAGKFKTHCLKLLDEVRDLHTEIVITKRGRPVARLVPVDADVPDSFGALAGTTVIHGDIVAPDHESWDDDRGA